MNKNVTVPPAKSVNQIPEPLRAQWKSVNLQALWESPSGKSHGNRAPEKPVVWRWDDVLPVLMETAKNSSPQLVERRVMVMANPESVAAGNDATTGVLSSNFQTLMPGERARPHRHSMNALRFVLSGSGAETIVDGKRCPMEAGDLILTPSWAWHEHVNAGNDPVIWADVLDVITHRAIGTDEFEPGPIHDLPVLPPDDAFSKGAFVPEIDMDGRPYSPIFRYPWAKAVEALECAPPAPDHSRRIRYANPLTGKACLSTIDCSLLQLAGNCETMSARSSASTICIAIEGSGVSYIDGAEVRWGPKDTFTVPQKSWASHKADSGGARLFAVSDREFYSRLGLLKEERRPPRHASS